MIGIKNASGEITVVVMIRNINQIRIHDTNDKIKVSIDTSRIADVHVNRIVGIGLLSKIWWKITKWRLRI